MQTSNQTIVEEDPMKYFYLSILGVLFTFNTATVLAQQPITISSPFYQMDQSLSDEITPNLSEPTAEINNSAQGAEAIMEKLITTVGGALVDHNTFVKEVVKDKDFYCIFHILRWSNPAGGKQTVQAQKWYLYHLNTLTLATATEIPRLYGVKRVSFLFIHLNKDPGNDYQPYYNFAEQKRQPAYISQLLGLAGLFAAQQTGSSARVFVAGAPTRNWWGFTTMQLKYKIADITATTKITRPTAVEELGEPQKFDNEGKYLMDFRVGVPIRKISELNFDSVNNTVAPREVKQSDILALVNVYPRPIDIRANNLDLVPHFVTGVAIDKQPLHKIFVGAGFGPIVANFYIGALFVKEDQLTSLTVGDSATSTQLNNDVRKKYKAKVAFGVNLPVGAIIEKLKGK